MQQSELTQKFVQLWNDQALDTHHDIIISVDYSIYNYNDTPNCGFCVSLFETIEGKPVGGGEGYSLAYTPNENANGLENAIYSIGFDINGIFAKRTPYVNGLENTTVNSICLRDGIKNNYNVLKQTENLLYSDNFTISQQLTSTDEQIVYKQARIIFSKCMGNMRVEVKTENEKEYREVLNENLPLFESIPVKVGLFYTSIDQNSRFNIKQFNVAGYPWNSGNKIKNEIPCYSEFPYTSNYPEQNKLPSAKNWFILNKNNGLDFYKFNGKEYIKTQEISDTNPLKVLNYNENLVYVKSDNDLIVYEFRGNKIIRQNTITLPSSDDITSCAGFEDTLVISSSSVGENYYVYNYVTESSNFSELGTWKFYQKFNFPTTSNFGTNVEMSKDYLLSYSTDNIVVSFKKDPNFGYVHHQTINPPYAGVDGFGYSISIQNNNEMLIGAPFGDKRYITGENQGEVFHYVLSPSTKQWYLVFEIGQYLNLDSLSGAFGYSVKINNNNVVIGSPLEPFYLNNDPLQEVEKQGKVYVFNRDSSGYFTEKTIYNPIVNSGDLEKRFGSMVNVSENALYVTSPYSNVSEEGNISVFNIDC